MRGYKIFVDENEFIKTYLAGRSLTCLMKDFRIGAVRARQILIRNDVEVRPNRGPAKYFNKHYFDVIDTQEKAYFLGLLYADGCVHKRSNRRSYEISLSLLESDGYLIYKFREELESKHKVRTSYSVNRRPQCSIAISSLYFGEQLIEHGMLTNKTWYLEFPDFLDRFLKPHFVRGFFDGDGSIYKRNNRDLFSVVIVSNKGFLDGLKKYLDDNDIITFISRNSSIYGLNCKRKSSVMDFMDLIYKDSTVKMERKYKKFLDAKSLYLGKNK